MPHSRDRLWDFAKLPAVRPDSAWNELGLLQPYFAVITNPSYLLEGLTSEGLRAFFESGQQEVDDLLSQARALFNFSTPTARAFDFGCGVGRLTIPLARHAGQVFALDAAPSMLERARAHCGDAHVENVEFLSPPALDSFPRGSINILCAHLVLQHLPTRDGEPALLRLLSLVAPGGLCSVDVTFSRPCSRLQQAVRWVRAHSRLVHAAALTIRRGRFLPYMQMNTYDVNSILRFLSEAGFSRSIVTVTRDGPLLSARFLSQKSF